MKQRSAGACGPADPELLADLGAALITAGWQPIATYDALKKKPEHAVFHFKASPPNSRGHNALRATVEGTRIFGARVCTHWMRLPPLPEEPA